MTQEIDFCPAIVRHEVALGSSSLDRRRASFARRRTQENNLHGQEGG